ncbi:MAG: SAM-dependent chlorinase/fluorinase [Polyangiaceae bacterium]|nr:SAM-dependent chlorinase/fluorinase [Myxococcales bacterium]MCB9585452.1 SAM-dependent chlorinase/fluorinase [Polyangiaceae bacterium]MCB9606532.1 SAM-dependent chlorinase/fluorinase [Polyangiaceae bacterium]
MTHRGPAGQRSGVLTLLTDFGLKDPFVGIMHGIVLQRAPNARIVDLTHHIRPQDIRAGAFYLRHAFHWFPRGTVHVAVVDPGVGSQRRALVVSVQGHCFVLPDNGLVGEVLALARRRGDQAEVREIDVSSPGLKVELTSHTFHGRDLFAPVGAKLVAGLPFAEVGAEVHEVVPTPNQAVLKLATGFEAEVVVVDHFGNGITNLELAEYCPEALKEPRRFRVRVQHLDIPLVRTYSEVAEGELCALVNSFGTLEIAERNGSAARQLTRLLHGDPPTNADSWGVSSRVRLLEIAARPD